MIVKYINEIEMLDKIGNKIGELVEMSKDFYENFLKNHKLSRGTSHPSNPQEFGKFMLDFLYSDIKEVNRTYTKFHNDYFKGYDIKT